MPTGDAYSSGHLVPSHLGLVYSLLVEINSFPELVIIFLDYAIRASLGTFSSLLKDKKKEIWPSPMTKAPTPTEKSKGKSDNTNNAKKKFD